MRNDNHAPINSPVVSRSQTTPSALPGGTEDVVWLRETNSPVALALDDHNGFSPESIHTEDTMATFKSKFYTLTSNDQLEVLNELLSSHAAMQYNLIIPEDYLQLSLKRMKHLEEVGKSNVLYELAKGLGTMRDDKSGSMFPVSRMPMGMLQYMVHFFNAKPGQTVRQNDD